MAIRLITGRPGSGKTLLAVQEFFEKILPDAVENGRQVFTNIEGLVLTDEEKKHVTLIEYEDVKDWMAGPDRAVWVIDECQYVFPPRSTSKPPPPWVEQLSTHRHRMMDFLLITQHPSLIDHMVKFLTKDHRNIVRPFGLDYSRVRLSQGVNNDPEPKVLFSETKLDRFKFPKAYYSKYRSAVEHNAKPELPWRLFGTAAVVLLVVGGGVFAVYNNLRTITDHAVTPVAGSVLVAQASCDVVGWVGGRMITLTSGGLSVGSGC